MDSTPIGAGNYSHQRVQTGSGAHSASYPLGPRGSSPDHSPPSSVEVNNMCRCTSISPVFFHGVALS